MNSEFNKGDRVWVNIAIPQNFTFKEDFILTRTRGTVQHYSSSSDTLAGVVSVLLDGSLSTRVRLYHPHFVTHLSPLER